MRKLLDRMYRWMESFIPCVLLFLAGCKAQAPLVVDSDTDSTATIKQEENRHTEATSSVDRESQQYFQRWQEMLTSWQGSWKFEQYSPPDSTGQQYRTSTVTGTFGGTKKEQSRDSLVVTEQMQGLRTEVTDMSRKLDRMEQTIRSLDAERKASISWWQAALMWLGGIGLAYVAVRLFWRKMP